MHQNISFFESLGYELESVLEVGSHLISRGIDSIDYHLTDIVLFRVANIQICP